MAAFFKPDITYIENEPFRAPEILGIFKCVAVAAYPGSDEQVAFGFYTNAYPGDNWHRAAMKAGDWSHGWLPADRLDGVWMPRTGSWDPADNKDVA